MFIAFARFEQISITFVKLSEYLTHWVSLNEYVTHFRSLSKYPSFGKMITIFAKLEQVSIVLAIFNKLISLISKYYEQYFSRQTCFNDW